MYQERAGREGFFDRHRIKFEQDHDVFEVTPIQLP
jgi:hypothetical protein